MPFGIVFFNKNERTPVTDKGKRRESGKEKVTQKNWTKLGTCLQSPIPTVRYKQYVCVMKQAGTTHHHAHSDTVEIY
jgi:hypothetical protein